MVDEEEMEVEVREEEGEGQGGRVGPDQMGDICSFHLGSPSEEPIKLTCDALRLLLPLINDAGKQHSKQQH